MNPRSLFNEALNRALAKADAALGAEIDRFYVSDPRFKSILDKSLDLQAERDRRDSGDQS